MWAWTVSRGRCYDLLDTFYALGGRRVDTATNYPINKRPADFRAAERILADWLSLRGVEDMHVMVKVGSVNNLMTPDHLLGPSFLQLCQQEYRALFGPNLHTLMIHWDNRDEPAAIRATLATLDEWRASGQTVGLSGIRYPECYAPLLAALDWRAIPLQLKHNLIYSDYARYAPLHERISPIAYGLTGGGLKLAPQAEGESLRARGGAATPHTPLLNRLRQWLEDWEHPAPPPTSMNQIGMLYALYHPAIDQVLLGGSRPAHLEDSFHWYEQLGSHDYNQAYTELQTLAHEQ
jgi:aryl-alcohol dehydrogenase-like predicted oxidoreductase